jgi:hypothetical protein
VNLKTIYSTSLALLLVTGCGMKEPKEKKQLMITDSSKNTTPIAITNADENDTLSLIPEELLSSELIEKTPSKTLSKNPANPTPKTTKQPTTSIYTAPLPK